MSELRQDLVSGDWIIMAPERAKRPHDFLPKKAKRTPSPKDKCPFEDIELTGNWPPIFSLPEGKPWQVAVIPNKYPALVHAPKCATELTNGPYRYFEGIGHHDLVVSRSHTRNLADMSVDEGLVVFDAFVKRFQLAAEDKCLVYTSAFFNWGPSAGASLFHPHYQVVTLPIIPPSVSASLAGSRAYHEKHKKCVHCVIVKHELKKKTRVIEENKTAVAFCPYVPRSRFEISVYPKAHRPYFERTPEKEMRGVVELLSSVLRRVRKNLNDPDLNFFIHTSPLKQQNRYGHYHWHIDVLPKILIPAGFELSTGIDINVIDPDWLASTLRGKNRKK